MTNTEENYCYYSKHFNIVCEKEKQQKEMPETYRLTALLNPGPLRDDGPISLEVVTNISEIGLDDAFELLKEKIYLTLDV